MYNNSFYISHWIINIMRTQILYYIQYYAVQILYYNSMYSVYLPYVLVYFYIIRLLCTMLIYIPLTSSITYILAIESSVPLLNSRVKWFFFFSDFQKWAHCHWLAIFLWAQFQTIGKFCHLCRFIIFQNWRKRFLT